MKNYVRDRLTIDAQHAIALVEQQSAVEHKGLRGRLRELVANRLLKPWLPPFVGCGTGTVIHGQQSEYRKSTQDDLIIFDRTLMPPILIEETAHEGVFLNNSVLLKLEIKSVLNATEVEGFAKAAKEFLNLGFVRPPGMDREYACKNLHARNCLLGFKSDTLDPSREFARYVKTMDKAGCPHAAGSILCVVPNGLWMLRQPDTARPVSWYRLKTSSTDLQGAERLACFTAILSETVAHAHCQRVGINPLQTFAAGIGLLFPHEDEWELETSR